MTSALTRYFKDSASVGQTLQFRHPKKCKSQPWAYKGKGSTTRNDKNANTMYWVLFTPALSEGT